jgi:hypothetical protein
LEQFRERIAAVIWVVDFTDFNCVVGKVVVDYEWKLFGVAEEPEDFAIVV